MSQEKISSPHWTAHTSDHEINEQNNEICISAKALNIIWGNDNRYWQWTSLPHNEINFSVGAELLQVNWIEVTGKLDFSRFKSTGEHEIVYLLKFKVDAFGWHSSPIKFKVMTSDGKETVHAEILEHYRKVSDNWHEIRGGKFMVPSGHHGAVHFGMYETESEWWKGSMILGGVKIRPTKAP
ncbi:protein PHLOEM PROTEIN 2-LIKE A1 [Cinnamomum micranthum f. kanehirae]|uniref:Protein PHLOEM PROTEIN 2-LIKE A1 n=1 Tax=Cinnamomum micranthum f. kanehirae TaxID=337451 RepID=A0A3S3N6X7_9MAGN|nr:protein PHLOEM PROTEIN 2-LIKE A1 [Cinnamomum micranthum f. kanehirae]